MADAISITVLTHSPSPYQVELFNTVAALSGVELRVIYLFSGDPTRKWGATLIRHGALMLDGNDARLGEAISIISHAGLAVFNYYNDPQAARLLQERVASRRPWAFWGERPGFSHPMLGRIARRWKLRSLHQSRAPIWGIGKFAVERYRREFGANRVYCNVPYFSDLSRFSVVGQASSLSGEVQRSAPVPGRCNMEGSTQFGTTMLHDPLTPSLSPSDGERVAEGRVRGYAPRTVLYSGSLIPRKGVDLLAEAFARVAPARPQLRLLVMGEGELRPAMEKRLQAVAGQVQFTGFQDWHALPEFYARADVLCVPSRHDGWGLVVPEGLASGMPVIGTDRMGAAIEFVVTGKNGWLVGAGDEGALHAALRDAASMPAEALAQLSFNARASVAEHSLENGAARFVAASREAVVNWSN